MIAQACPMDPLSAAFSALADPTRRAILARLAQGDTHVGDLVKPFAISGPAISRHLRVLEQAQLIERTVHAQWRVCRLRGPGLRAAHDWLTQYRAFWDASLDRLVDLLEQTPGPPPETGSAAPQPAQRAERRQSRRPRSPLPRTPKRKSS